jgi:transposase
VATERDEPQNLWRRRVLAALLTVVDAKRLVFLDESSCNTAMAREYGWAPIGHRAVGERPGRSWKTLTLIGAIRLGSRPKLMTHKGAVNGPTFLKFVRRRLVPWLKKGDVVLMDNLSAHKVNGVQEAIQRAGALVIYLPAYSPDMNPIELWWPYLKRHLRKLAPRLQHELARVARRLRASTPIPHLEQWFAHCLAFPQVN